MLQLERKGWEWIEKNLCILVMIAVTIIGGVIRLSLREHESDDMLRFLCPWYHIILVNGQLGALKTQVGNYNILYQFLIALMTYLPFNPITSYKLLSCIFDYLLAISMGCLASCGGDEVERRWKFLAAYSMVLLSPIVITNSAVWGQCDSIYTFWLVLAILFLIKEKYIHTFIFFGIALSFKLQAVFLLPFLLFAYFYLKKFSLLHFGIAPIVLWLSGLPAYLAGRDLGAAFTIYQSQVVGSFLFCYNYPSFWLLLIGGGTSDGSLYKTTTILTSICVLAAWMIWWIYRQVEWNEKNLLYMAFLLSYTAVLFLPAMHDRYSYIYEILAIGIAIRNKKTLPLLLLLIYISSMTYGGYLFMRPIDYDGLVRVNCIVYIVYSYMLNKEMLLKKSTTPLQATGY